MDKLLHIWKIIVQQCEKEQILEGEKKGLVRNFIIDDVYLREAAFAAKIFVTEYIRTNNNIYLEKTRMALDALMIIFKNKNMIEGIDEPFWTPRGISLRKGSIPATILLLYAIDETIKLIGYKFDYSIKDVTDYLASCYLGNGKFYHDKIDRNNRAHKNHIVNTTAMSYFFLQLAQSRGVSVYFYRKEMASIENAIRRSQRSDGFWSYMEPNIFQKTFFVASKFMPKIVTKYFNIIMGDRSIFFGDATHHIITLYYYIVGKSRISKKLTDREYKMIKKGWKFIKDNLKSQGDNGISFDFSWEPKPKRLRYCNFIDTSIYFYILDLLYYLETFSIIDLGEKERYTEGILTFIRCNLLINDTPSIKAYQGGEDFIRNIMPRLSESVFDKGFFLSNVVLKSMHKNEK